MKRAFTLIEIIVSTLILFLIVFALSKAYATLKTGIVVAKKLEEKSLDKTELIRLLYSDFVQASDINITAGKDFDIVQVSSTRNSLYDAPNSSVLYLVTKSTKELLRIESREKVVLPIVGADQYKYNYLPFGKELKSFKVLKSSRDKSLNCSLLIFIEFRESAEPLLFEFALLNRNGC